MHGMHTPSFFLGTSLLLLVASPNLFATNQPQVEELLRSRASWDGTTYKAYPGGQPEVTLLKIAIPANTTLDWHSHPIPNAGYVLSGELTLQARDSDLQRTLRAGDAIAEMVDRQHRGLTGDLPVELIVFYAGAEGLPLSE
jgi:quercetin dioxygenase-like cupin family protein